MTTARKTPVPAGLRWLLVAIVALVPAMVHLQPGTAAAQTVPADLHGTGEKLAALVQAGDVAQLADRFIQDQVTCPVDPAFPGEVCIGQSDGAVVSGYHVGRYQSQPGVVGRASLESLLSEFIGALPGSAASLRTIALATDAGCTGCGSIVVAASSGAQHVIVFDVRPTVIGPRVFAVTGGTPPGGLLTAMVHGGEAGGRTYVVAGGVVPLPPSVGTGLASADSGVPMNAVAGLSILAIAATATGARLRAQRSR